MTRETATSARTVLGGLVVFLVLVLAPHLLRSEYDFRSRWLSEYAIGPYGWIMNAAFLALAVTEGVLAIGMLQGGPPSAWVRSGAALLGVAALALALLPVLPTDLDAPGQVGLRLRTLAGLWHDQLNAVSGYATLGTMGCWAIAFRSAAEWRQLAIPTGIIAAVLVANGIFAPLVLPRELAGLSQRFAVLLTVAWLGTVGLHLLPHQRFRLHSS
jgi:hypothetical protein